MNPSSHSILNSSTQNDHWDTTGWFLGALAHLVGLSAVLSNRNHDIEAEITFLPTDAGGRCTPVMSGYRPNHDFGISDMTNDAHHEYVDKHRVFPGETVIACLWFLRPDFQNDRLYVGMEFTVQEGGRRLVGNGRIVRVCDPALEKAT